MPTTLTPDILNLVVVGLLGVGAILLSIIAFFLKHWFDKVNEHISQASEALKELVGLKITIHEIKEDVQENKLDVQRLHDKLFPGFLAKLDTKLDDRNS